LRVAVEIRRKGNGEETDLELRIKPYGIEHDVTAELQEMSFPFHQVHLEPTLSGKTLGVEDGRAMAATN